MRICFHAPDETGLIDISVDDNRIARMAPGDGPCGPFWLVIDLDGRGIVQAPTLLSAMRLADEALRGAYGGRQYAGP